jgi:hypothetical protein
MVQTWTGARQCYQECDARKCLLLIWAEGDARGPSCRLVVLVPVVAEGAGNVAMAEANAMERQSVSASGLPETAASEPHTGHDSSVPWAIGAATLGGAVVVGAGLMWVARRNHAILA